MPAPVIVTDYDPRWPARFARLRHQLADVLGSLAVRIEHVGSTAVPGLAAKPIIDWPSVTCSAPTRRRPPPTLT
jgi:GrpB-like predicted nucleotidyltransferase (UPF0157 family)